MGAKPLGFFLHLSEMREVGGDAGERQRQRRLGREGGQAGVSCHSAWPGPSIDTLMLQTRTNVDFGDQPITD